MASNLTALASNPEFAPQVQGLDRQRKIAEMLMTQGFQPQQGQMVSGHYVAPSWTQQLAGLANIWAGKGMQEEADTKQQELAKALRTAGQKEMQDWIDAKQGITNVAQAGPPTDEMIENKQFALPTRQEVGQPMDRLSLALKGMNAKYNQALPGLGAELMKQEFAEPEWVKDVKFDDKGREIHGWVNKKSPNPELTFRGDNIKPGLTQAQIIEFTDKGIDVSPYLSTPNNPPVMGQPPVGNQPSVGGKPSPTFTPATNQKDFYNQMYKTAFEKAKAMGAPNPEALATLAATQSSIETGSGKHLAGGNNYFGIKGGNNPQPTQEWDAKQGKMITIRDSFRQYGDMGQSVDDYLNLLKGSYPAAFNAKSPQEAFIGITSKNPRGMMYMTDPNYLGKLQTWNASLTGAQPPSGNQPSVNNQPPVGNAPPNAPSQKPIAYKLVQEYNDSLKPPTNVPAQVREWNVEVNKPLSGDPSKRVSGAINTIDAIDNYRKIAKDYSKLSSLSPEQRTNLTSAYNTMVLQSKEAYALGVLNGQDYNILKSLTPNPNDLKNLLVTNNTLSEQAAKQRQTMSNTVINAYGEQQKKIPSYIANKITPIENEVPPNAKPTSGWGQAKVEGNR